MNRKPVPRHAVSVMVAIGLILAISLVVILAVACLIGKMGDSDGRVVLECVALAVGLIWIIDLVCLVLAVGVNSLYDSDHDSNSEPPLDGSDKAS